MNAVAWIVAWGLAALAAAVLGGFLAASKYRSASVWIAWCFLLPPLVLLLWLLPPRDRPPPRRRSRDEEIEDELEGLDKAD